MMGHTKKDMLIGLILMHQYILLIMQVEEKIVRHWDNK